MPVNRQPRRRRRRSRRAYRPRCRPSRLRPTVRSGSSRRTDPEDEHADAPPVRTSVMTPSARPATTTVGLKKVPRFMPVPSEKAMNGIGKLLALLEPFVQVMVEIAEQHADADGQQNGNEGDEREVGAEHAKRHQREEGAVVEREHGDCAEVGTRPELAGQRGVHAAVTVGHRGDDRPSRTGRGIRCTRRRTACPRLRRRRGRRSTSRS